MNILGLLTLQGKHTIAKVVVEVFNVTKLGKVFKKASAINHKYFSVGFKRWYI